MWLVHELYHTSSPCRGLYKHPREPDEHSRPVCALGLYTQRTRLLLVTDGMLHRSVLLQAVHRFCRQLFCPYVGTISPRGAPRALPMSVTSLRESLVPFFLNEA